MCLPWWQMEFATVGMCQCIKADVKTLLADVIAMGLYFIFSSVVLTITSSHTWGRWYLPMFLFRDGLLTLMYIDSFINLERLCSSIPTILKLLSVTPNNDGSLQTKVYRKSTHTNQYLKWDSHRAISNKYSVISSLIHRANGICSSQDLLEEEQKQIQEALILCKYPMWAINRMKTKISAPRNNRNNNQNNRPTCKGSITVPYNEGLSETFKNLCKKYGIEVRFKNGKTIKDEIVAPKDKDHITKKVV